MRQSGEELVFLPLGGVGEIGMNLAVYGWGPPRRRSWIAVDFGIAFAGDRLPGVDVILPDIAFLEEERERLAGIVISHAHEDHFGALIDLWPRLRVPVYATPFAAGLLAAKLASEPGASAIPITVVAAGDRFTLGPFHVEYVSVAHSIPESCAIVMTTPAGVVVHSADWKIDPSPVLGAATDGARLRQLGDAGVLALICDSTNAMREGRSPSEADVAREITAIVKDARARVAFTSFASNVGRIRTIAAAAAACGRDTLVAGRAMRRAIDVAAELGMMDSVPPFVEEEAFSYLPRDKVVVLLTGSQGESRAALARVADDEHRNISLSPGDTVVFSSRTIPGNEVAVNSIINRLTTRGVHVLTDRDRLVHASGHPRRDELRDIYRWLRPRIAVPVHGEAMHLAAHADLASDIGVETVMSIRNGSLVRLSPEPAETIAQVASGRLYKDARVIGGLDDIGVLERRRLAMTGHAAVSLVLFSDGSLHQQPEISLLGLPLADPGGTQIVDVVRSAVLGTIESIPRPRRRDTETLREAVRRSVRAAVQEAWGKKPNCTVFVTIL